VLRAERRRRSDLVLAALLVAAVAAVAAVLAVTAPAANTTSVTASAPVPMPPPAPPDVPDRLIEAWRAPSAATPAPVVVGPVVVTGDVPEGTAEAGHGSEVGHSSEVGHGSVVGRDPLTGRPVWSYTRDLSLCTVGSGWGQALAMFRDDGYCSEVTALQAATGERGPQRNADTRALGRLLDDGYLVTASDPDYLEVWRSDLVKTLSYGTGRAEAQPDRQPRPQCRHLSAAVTDGRLAVLERCPGEPGDRLTVLRPDGNEADRPEEQFSVSLPTGARLVAVSFDVAAVLLPGPTRLSVRGGDGAEVASYPLDLPPADLPGAAQDPPPGTAPASVEGPHGVLWWTGTRTVGLDAAQLRPQWTVPDSLGPGTPWAGRVVVPVRAGLAVLDADTGAPLRVVPVDRGGYTGPVWCAAQGPVLYEQRGSTLVALGL
jgi:hypothetical protein